MYLVSRAERNMGFDADATDETDDQPCSECEKMCEPIDRRTEE
jgi:hypothetical protein